MKTLNKSLEYAENALKNAKTQKKLVQEIVRIKKLVGFEPTSSQLIKAGIFKCKQDVNQAARSLVRKKIIKMSEGKGGSMLVLIEK